jgi:hypothetical protein
MGAAQQSAEINAAHSQNAKAAITAYQDDIESAQLDAMSSQENNSLSILQNRREGLRARASSRAAAAERGIGGLSQGAVEQALGFASGESVAYVRRNMELDSDRYRLSARAAGSTAKARINSAPTSRGPSALSLVANLGSAAVSAYSMKTGMDADAARTAAAGRT